MTTYADLERRYDGFISQDDKDRVAGLDPDLMRAHGAVRFWRERLRNAVEAYQGTPDDTRRNNYLAMLEAFKRAHAHRRLVENHATAGMHSIIGGLR